MWWDAKNDDQRSVAITSATVTFVVGSMQRRNSMRIRIKINETEVMAR